MSKFYHTQLVDYIRVSTLGHFAPQKPIVAVADFTEYQEWVLMEVCDYLGLLVPDCLVTRVGHYGYKTAIPVISGVTLYVLPHSEKMGTCLQISGVGMTSLRYAGWGDVEIVAKLWEDGFRFSRLDTVIDTYNGYVTKDVVEAVTEFGVCPTAGYKKPVYMHDMIENAMTLYLGSRTSSRFARIYDKSVYESEVEQRTRYELEYKGDDSKWAAQVLCIEGWQAIAYDMIYHAMIRGVPSFPDISNIDAVVPTPRTVPETESSKAVWVRRCIKAITEGIREMGAPVFCELVNKAARANIIRPC